jgi:hypothetical protein
MSTWNELDKLDRLFIVWAFLFQIVLIIHFALRKPFFGSYTVKFGWIVYALCIPAVVVSIILLRGGKSWSFWLGGFLFLIYAVFGYWVGPNSIPKPASIINRDSIRVFISRHSDVLLVAALAS